MITFGIVTQQKPLDAVLLEDGFFLLLEDGSLLLLE